MSGSIGVTGAQQGVVRVTDLVDGLAGVELGVAAVARQMTLKKTPVKMIVIDSTKFLTYKVFEVDKSISVSATTRP